MVKVLGITDERTDCECCGKSGLKKTVALDFDGLVRYFGVDCAGLAVHGRKTRANATRVVNAANEYVRNEAMTTKHKLQRVRKDLNSALYAYIGTKRSMDRRAKYRRNDEIVIVDLSDAADVRFYESAGFSLEVKF